jgi:hypothetical protein
MLKDLFKPLLEMDSRESLEFFQDYWKLRALDMLKAPTWEAKKEKKEKKERKEKSKVTKPRKKRAKKVSLSSLPPEVIELLKKTGAIK